MLGLAYFYVREHEGGRKYHDWRCDECRKYACIARNLAMTVTDYRALLAEYPACAICGRSWESGIRPNIDHCHTSGKLRGVLCVSCNSALGLLRDSPDSARRAAAYLEEWQSIHAQQVQTESDVMREYRMRKIRTRAAVQSAL